MSDQKLRGLKVAFLIENGFCERECVQAQRALKAVGMDCRFISVDQNMVRGWNETRMSNSSDWGAEFAIDKNLKNALATDYTVLVIPGGKRSVDKLKNAPETKSFVTSFLHTGKPVIAYNLAVDFLTFSDLIGGYTVAAKGHVCETVKTVSGARCVSPDFVVSKNLITLSTFIDAEDKIKRAVSCIFSGESYADKIVGADHNMPHAHKVA